MCFVRARARGKVAVCGTVAVALAVAAPVLGHRLRSGDLDPSFGNHGNVTSDFPGGQEAIHSIAIDAKGRIVAGGGQGRRSGYSKFELARYTRNTGRVDRSFAGTGYVKTEFGDFPSGIRSVAIDSRGRIVAAGARCGEFPDCDIALACYMPDGRLDRSFSDDGKVTTGFEQGAFANSLAIDSRGRIVVAGVAEADHPHFMLARYRPNGTLDPAFGSAGEAATDFPDGPDWAEGVTIDSRGRIVAAGVSSLPGGGTAFALARYRPNGHLDPSFGDAGQVKTAFPVGLYDGEGISYSVAIDAQGRIVAAGGTTEAGGDFALARYRPTGNLDPSFGTGGRALTPFRNRGSIAHSIAIDSRGRLVAVGNTYDPGADRSEFALARYRSDGGLDRSFSGNGKASSSLARHASGADSVVIDSRDRIVAAGSAGSKSRFALARYIGYR
jgi:uncharacterized delta-60 repeat protein